MAKTKNEFEEVSDDDLIKIYHGWYDKNQERDLTDKEMEHYKEVRAEMRERLLKLERNFYDSGPQYVKCHANYNYEDTLTEGKVYEVIERQKGIFETRPFYTVISDKGAEINAHTTRFTSCDKEGNEL